MRAIFISIVVLLLGCATPNVSQSETPVTPLQLHDIAVETTHDYLYLTTIIGKPLLPPPIFEFKDNPNPHTAYNNAYDSYVNSLLDYRTYISLHLMSMVKGAQGIDESLVERVRCMEYVEEILKVPEPPSVDDLRAAAEKSNDDLQLAMSVYIQQQREYITVIASALRRYRQIRSRCPL